MSVPRPEELPEHILRVLTENVGTACELGDSGQHAEAARLPESCLSAAEEVAAVRPWGAALAEGYRQALAALSLRHGGSDAMCPDPGALPRSAPTEQPEAELPAPLVQALVDNISTARQRARYGDRAGARAHLEQCVRRAEEAAADGYPWGAVLAEQYRQALERLAATKDESAEPSR